MLCPSDNFVAVHSAASNDNMCDQFHEGTGFLTHHLALTNSFEVLSPFYLYHRLLDSIIVYSFFWSVLSFQFQLSGFLSTCSS